MPIHEEKDKNHFKKINKHRMQPAFGMGLSPMASREQCGCANTDTRVAATL